MFLHFILHVFSRIHHLWEPLIVLADSQLNSISYDTSTCIATLHLPLISSTFTDFSLFTLFTLITTTFNLLWNFKSAYAMDYWQHCFLPYIANVFVGISFPSRILNFHLLRILFSPCAFHRWVPPLCLRPPLVGKNWPYKYSCWRIYLAFPATWMLLHAVMLSASTVAYTQLGLFSILFACFHTVFNSSSHTTCLACLCGLRDPNHNPFHSTSQLIFTGACLRLDLFTLAQKMHHHFSLP